MYYTWFILLISYRALFECCQSLFHCCCFGLCSDCSVQFVYDLQNIRKNTDKRLYIAAISLGTPILCLLLLVVFYASMEALQQSQALCVVSNVVSILSATVCVICLTLTGIMYIYGELVTYARLCRLRV